jgi:hypothetical protein
MIADIPRMLTTRYNADVRWWQAAVLLYACGAPGYGPTPSTPRDAALESGTASDATALTLPATDARRAGELGDWSTVRARDIQHSGLREDEPEDCRGESASIE